MLSLQEEHLINQDRMIELLEYSNALEMTHIALTADIARTNAIIASNLTEVNQSVNTIKINDNYCMKSYLNLSR